MGIQVNAGGSVTVENFDGRRDYYTVSGSNYVAPPGLETTLVHNATGTWTLTYRDHTTKSFDANGKLIQITDVDGNATNLTYVSGRLDTVTDAANRDFVFGYDANGRVSSISIPLSRSLGYTYDTAGNLLTFTDPAGAVTHYAYGADHMITSVTDASGRASTIAWTSLRRIKSVTDPTGAVTTYAYGSQSASGGSTSVTDARGTVTTHTYDARGRQTQISRGDAGNRQQPRDELRLQRRRPGHLPDRSPRHRRDLRLRRPRQRDEPRRRRRHGQAQPHDGLGLHQRRSDAVHRRPGDGHRLRL